MISICIPTYNGESYISEQIISIISQLRNFDEIIISDDCSTDQTIELIKSFNDDRIKIFCNDKSHGIISNIESALNQAKGDIIFLSDQDDVWLQDKVKICKQALVDSDLVISDCIITDRNLNVINDSFFVQNKSQINKYRAIIRNPYLGCCMAFNRKVLNKSLPFPSGIPMHDIWIGNVAAFNFKVSFIPDKLIYYRRHGENASTTSEPTKANILQQIKYRLPVIKGLLKIFFNF
ncbi:MAG: glycosyltransferase [Paludibacter sp.]